MTLYRPPLTREQIELLTEAVDDALPLWKEYGETMRWMKLLATANSLSEYISLEKVNPSEYWDGENWINLNDKLVK